MRCRISRQIIRRRSESACANQHIAIRRKPFDRCANHFEHIRQHTVLHHLHAEPIELLRKPRRVTIGDLAATQDEHLRATLGAFGVGLARLARGEDERDVEPYREAKSYGEENTFARDVATRAALTGPIRAHADAVARRLRHDRVAGHGVTVKLKLARPLGGGRYPLVTRSMALKRPTDDGDAIARAALTLLERVDPWEPIRLVGVSVTRLVASDETQLTLTPGEHTLQLLFGDASHVSFSPAIASRKITITVK